MPDDRLPRLLGVELPLISAPMAGIAHGRLAAAVSAAGGLGMIGVGVSATPEWVAEQSAIAARAPGRFGIGFMAWALRRHPEQLDAAIAAQPALISFSFGDYADYGARCRDAGIAVATQVGNRAEAEQAVAAGVDLIVARGAEAGGHGRNEVAMMTLLQEVLELTELPVLAAGGIATRRGFSGVLAAGAAGAWVGTAFLACPEATTTDAARERLFAAGASDTVYGRVFDIAQRLPWPAEYGGRALRNSFFDRWAGREGELAADDAAQAELLAAKERHDFDIAYIYAGQGVGFLRETQPAAEVVAALAG